jgi:hypothetical protein
MDPNWATCAYCDAESRANPKTATQETTGRNTGGPDVVTRIDTRTSDASLDTTLVDIPFDPLLGTRIPAQERMITGVLVTFSRKSQGELFILHEGRNVIGWAESCDIQIKTDKRMSDEHAVILCQAGRNELYDLSSKDGTFINDEYARRDGVDVGDGAIIKIGDTAFEFRKITSSANQAPHTGREQ